MFKSIVSNKSMLCCAIIASCQVNAADDWEQLVLDYVESASCTVPTDGIYRIKPNIDHIHDRLNKPNICWSQVNTIIIPPLEDNPNEDNQAYRFVKLFLTDVTAARAARANDAVLASTHPEAVDAAKQPLLITNGLSEDNYINQTNLNHTQVVIKNRWGYALSIEGGKNWKLSGAGDLTHYPGHYGEGHESYANTQGKYGILVDGQFTYNSSTLGIAAERRKVDEINYHYSVSDFEIEYLELTRAGFAGMMIKTEFKDPNDNNKPFDNSHLVMNNVKIHDNYIHDSFAEGIYFGSTTSDNSAFQHKISNIEISNNRIVRSGAEGLQLSQLAGQNEIFNNVIVQSGTSWLAPFKKHQDSAVQMDFRSGNTWFRNNIVVGAGNALLVIGDNYDGKPKEGDGINIHKNYFSGTRHLGTFIKEANTKDLSPKEPTFSFSNNTWRNQQSQYGIVDVNFADYKFLHKIYNSDAKITFNNETWSSQFDSDHDGGMIKSLPTGNGTGGKGEFGTVPYTNVTGGNNNEAPINTIDVAFFANIDSFFTEQGDGKYLDELNTLVHSPIYRFKVKSIDGQPITYAEGSIVMTQYVTNKDDTTTTDFGGTFYKCISATGCTNALPGKEIESPVWLALLSPFNESLNTPLKDNFHLDNNSPYTGLGIQAVCEAATEFKILPIKAGGSFDNSYFPVDLAYDEQMSISYDNTQKKPISLPYDNEPSRFFFYADENKGRKAYFDLGENYANLRIEEIWTRYARWSQRTVGGNVIARNGFKQVTWHNSLAADSVGILEPQINFHTALISDQEHFNTVWKRDYTNIQRITPKGRYLVVETYPMSDPLYDYSRAIEFALVGWQSNGHCR